MSAELNGQKSLHTLVGKVISDRMDKTVVVEIVRKVKHPIYGKYVKRSTKLHVHDEQNQSHVGDTVVIAETRPISKTKAWRLVEVKQASVNEAV